MVKVVPEKIDVPPVAVVYQLKLVPGDESLAVIAAVCPEVICALKGDTANVGVAGMGFTITSACALLVLTQLPDEASA